MHLTRGGGVHVAGAEIQRPVRGLRAAPGPTRSPSSAEPVPLVIRNAPTKLMKELHYGEGYQYAHDTEEKLTAMQCLPDSLAGKKYYRPTEQGSEARVKERLRQIEAWKAERRKKSGCVEQNF